jgi:transposase InsO family protein
MGWSKVTIMSQRQAFIETILQGDSNFSQICRQFGISRKTGYKFLHRYIAEGPEGLSDRSRRPKHSAGRTAPCMEQLLLHQHCIHPAWGARKLKRRLADLGYTGLPAASTVTVILKRHGCITEEKSRKHKAWQRFSAAHPNDLWQMDFKGHFPAREGRCHPLTVLDDHARYCLCIAACRDEQAVTVQSQLIRVFRTYGVPHSMLMDNGPPWGNRSEFPHTVLTVWLMRIGIRVIHSRPRHPQTVGKDERFHRTMCEEILPDCTQQPIAHCQKAFDQWRTVYNYERPHESLDMQVPSKCYRSSNRPFPEKLPEVEYDVNDLQRKVYDKGFISFHNQEYRIGKAFIGQRVALRPACDDGCYDVFFCNQRIASIDAKEHT